ncbi:MAG: hypothetical protein ACE5HD_01120 [Acidobacteriota bacterium]
MSRDRLLISLDDMTPLRGRETVQEIFFILLGYDPRGKAGEMPLAETYPQVARVLPEGASLRKWFYAGVTPVITMRKGIKHRFPGGFPLYDCLPPEIVSFYFAVIESDRSARDTARILAGIQGGSNEPSLIRDASDLITSMQPGGAILRQALGLLVKGVEVALINNRDDIRYTNIFTFKSRENYLAGTHTDWGNQRIALTLRVEYGRHAPMERSGSITVSKAAGRAT